ncbi:hypothetical protein [Planctomicrobium sp. SH664]|uniref:hypothetical protein n=1 Tax=Planctomicrobium sp. SH664 TaxID=3448125 RepID=UPI003F5C4262
MITTAILMLLASLFSGNVGTRHGSDRHKELAKIVSGVFLAISLTLFGAVLLGFGAATALTSPPPPPNVAPPSDTDAAAPPGRSES